MDAPVETPPAQAEPQTGSFGPGGDIPANQPITPQASGSWRIVVAIAIGALVAIPFGSGKMKGFWDAVGSAMHTAVSSRTLSLTTPQKDAERLLARAVGHDQTAISQVAGEVDGWRGRIQLTSELNSQLTAALNSDDMRVREMGIEVDLAAMGLSEGFVIPIPGFHLPTFVGPFTTFDARLTVTQSVFDFASIRQM